MKKMTEIDRIYYENDMEFGPCQEYLKELEDNQYHPCNNYKTIEWEKYATAKEWKEAMKIRIEKRNSINRALCRT